MSQVPIIFSFFDQGMSNIMTDTKNESKMFHITEYHADGYNNVVYNETLEFADIDEAIQWVKDSLVPDEWLAELDEDGDPEHIVLSYCLSKEDLEDMAGESISDEDFEESEPVVYSWNIDDVSEDYAE